LKKRFSSVKKKVCKFQALISQMCLKTKPES
jgi:hypothetical protein